MKPKKPGYDIVAEQDKLVKAVCSFFGRVYDDLEEKRHLALREHRPGDEKWVEVMGAGLWWRSKSCPLALYSEMRTEWVGFFFTWR